MEKSSNKFFVFLAFMMAIFAGLTATNLNKTVLAEEGEAEAETTEEVPADGMSISISPVSKILKLEDSSVYEDYFTIKNSGAKSVKFETYAAPYSYNYSEETDTYSLGFNKENNYTQITRWVTFRDDSGNWVANAKYTVDANDTKEVHYRISTPASVPNGGQYAVLFAHTLSEQAESGGIKTEASPGLVVYGRSAGETTATSEIRNMKIDQWVKHDVTEETPEGEKKTVTKDFNRISASAKVKNTGNIDFNAVGKLTVSGLFGGTIYETPSTRGRTSIIPETELSVSDEWEETPAFGIFRVTWEVATGDKTETISTIIAINIAPLIIFIIIVLTIFAIGAIIGVKKRKERRSRFAV